MFTDDSDYVVEQYIRPNKVRKRIINDERADILGNFDDDDNKFKKKAKKLNPVVESEENPFVDADESEDEVENGVDDDAEDESNVENNSENNSENEGDEGENESDVEDESGDVEAADEDDDQSEDSQNISGETEVNSTEQVKPVARNKIVPSNEKKKSAQKNSGKQTALTDDQIKALVRGCSKKDRFVLYVTNLNYSTTREELTEFFSVAGPVKSVRVPKVRRSAFAFIEMSDLNGFKNALALHNRTLDNYTIKVQISEAGKKKSANKKNILKQKNRKLAEMRNETKQFQRSGKGYDKTIKKEINQQKIQQNRRLAKKQAKKQKQA